MGLSGARCVRYLERAAARSFRTRGERFLPRAGGALNRDPARAGSVVAKLAIARAGRTEARPRARADGCCRRAVPSGAGGTPVDVDLDRPFASARAGARGVAAGRPGGIAMATLGDPIVRQRAGVDRAGPAGAVRIGPYALLAFEERVTSKVRVRTVLAFEPIGAAKEPDGGLTGRTRAWRPRYGARACAGTARRARARPARRARGCSTRRAARGAALTRTARAGAPAGGPRAARRSTAFSHTARRAARAPTRRAAIFDAARRAAARPRFPTPVRARREGDAPTLDQSKAAQRRKNPPGSKVHIHCRNHYMSTTHAVRLGQRSTPISEACLATMSRPCATPDLRVMV
jgi:hypothetical protein